MRRWTGRSRWAALAAIAAVLALPALAEKVTHEQLLGNLTNLDRLTLLEPGAKAGQYSSYSRNEEVQWATNADAGNFLRIDPSGEGVMMDQDGPGCIVRIWSANPEGTLRIYLDGATEPTIEADFNDFFLGKVEPFVQPLVWKRAPEPMSAADCYMPIPFAKHVKVTCDPPNARFYQVGYIRYPDDWAVDSFQLPLTPGQLAARDAAAAAWANCGTDPKRQLDGQTTARTEVTLEPGATVSLADLEGPGVIRALRVRADSKQREYWRKLVLRGVWDGAREPQLLSPLGPFLGFSGTAVDYSSLVSGYREGQGWFYYPMPFRRTAELTLTSWLEEPATIDFEVEWAPQPTLPPETLTFNARWRHEVDSTSLDYPLIETAGRGQLVGVTLQVDHPIDGWWGEGDEKIWVDDDAFPKWIGTGSEDYFGDAWGIRHLPGPSWGCSGDPEIHGRLRTEPYRWHFADPIPFTKRLRMTIENYGAWPQLTFDEFEYSSVAYWYQAELTPPWHDLVGATYTGGATYLQKPATYHYRPDVFPRKLTGDDVRTTGLDVPFAREAEDLLAGAVRAGKARIITDARLPFELSRERAIDFGAVTAGARLAEFRLGGLAPGVYFPTLLTAALPDACELTLQWEGRGLPVAGHPAEGRWDLEGIAVDATPGGAALIAVTAGQAVLDAIQVLPAPRREGVLEAEELIAVGFDRRGPKPGPGLPTRGLSAGRALEFPATGEGQSFLLTVPRKSEAAYILGVQPVLGPDCGKIQAFVAGEAIGPAFDLYQAAPGLGPTFLPLGPLPVGAEGVEIRVVGRNAAASGYAARLDCVRFEPMILHPESTEGVTAQVVGLAGCAYSIQDLGPNWIGGHHLWVNPSGRDAWIDIALDIPAEADYVLGARYTTSWDYAIGQATLDGQPLGGRLDFYTKGVAQTPPVSYGAVHLTAGRHVFRLQAVDKSAQSAGYLMGVDYIRVEKAR